MEKKEMGIEDENMAEIMAVAGKIAKHTNDFQAKTVEKTEQIEGRVSNLEKEVDELKKKG